MTALRWMAIVGAAMLMVGEVYRSWGVGRPIMFVLDDMIVGTMMITAAVLVARPTLARRCYFSAAWGAAAGMLYNSFFGKLLDPANSDPGNLSLGLLTALLGIAFALAIAGLIASIVLLGHGASE